MPTAKLTPAEVEEIAERKTSADARKRFGLRLRRARAIEDKPRRAAWNELRRCQKATLSAR